MGSHSADLLWRLLCYGEVVTFALLLERRLIDVPVPRPAAYFWGTPSWVAAEIIDEVVAVAPALPVAVAPAPNEAAALGLDLGTQS